MDFNTYQARTIHEGAHVWWTGAKTRDGYGKHNATYVHRWLVEQDTEVPRSWEVDHTCGQRHPEYGLCVAREHLEPVTRAENMRRMGERTTHCRHGHLYTPENTYRSPKSGRKSCRTCRAALTKAFLDRNPGYQENWYREKKAR